MPKAGFQKKSNLFCSGCLKEFKRKSDLSNHSCNVTLEGLEVTIKTEEVSSQGEDFQVEKLDENTFSCTMCQRTFKSIKGCKIHMSSHFSEKREHRPKDKQSKGKQYVCTYCPQIFTTLKEYRIHYKMHNIIEPSLMEKSDLIYESDSSALKTSSLCTLKPSDVKSSENEIETNESKIYQKSISNLLKIAAPRTLKTEYCESTTKTKIGLKSTTMKITSKSPKSYSKGVETTPQLNKKIREKEYVCSRCNLKFHKLKDYRAHYKTHPPDYEIAPADYENNIADYETVTGECDRLTTDCETLTADSKVPTENYSVAKLHECPNCSKTFIKIGSFRRHLRSHLNIHAYTCKHCLLSFLTKPQLVAHVKQKCKIEENKYSCGLCDKKFYHRMGFMQHKTEHISNPPYKCPTCGALFRSISRRVRHLAHHSVKCPVCCKTFASDIKLWQHLSEIHFDIEDFDIPCDILEEEKNREEHFYEMDVDSDADSFTSIDSDSNNTKEKIKVPVQKCLKKKNAHVCFICEQRFPKLESLNFHMKSHKIYVCALCPKFFPYESNLKEHQLEHDQNKIFDDLLHSAQFQPINSNQPISQTSIPIQTVESTASELEKKSCEMEETEKPHNILEWYNSFNELLGNLKFPIGHDLYLDINRNISEMTTALYNDNLSQETRDTYKKIYLRLTGIIRKNGETLCG